MAEEKRKDRSSRKDKPEKKEKKDKSHKQRSSKADETTTPTAQPSLLADDKIVDTKLSSLFAAKPVVKKSAPTVPSTKPAKAASLALDEHDHEDVSAVDETTTSPRMLPKQDVQPAEKNRKRKRKEESDDLEDTYLRKLARQQEQEVEQLKREKHEDTAMTEADLPGVEPDQIMASDGSADHADAASVGVEIEADDNDDEHFVPPQHESQTAASTDLEKSNRTVFIGNVSTSAVTTKSARKELEKHLTSFFDSIPKTKDDAKTTHKLESIRFRSTPYAPMLPKKAAYARGEIMDTTTHSTNAYAVYSSPLLVREACRRLNGTVVLDRHIRIDSVAHPAPLAHKRCVFVGNLGFVDDESNIIAANEAEGREKRKQNQKPSDVEEGLWRLFSKHGTVENVRVVRDKGTRVGIGIAYVQFTDENAVESALSEEGKKAPPMLPRKLRVTRAKAMKRSRPSDKSRGRPEKTEGYKRKVTPGEATLKGRMGKLMGKAAASQASSNFKSPESFVFEGHRASSKQKNTGLKLGKTVKKAKPTRNSGKRAAAYKAGKVKKSS